MKPKLALTIGDPAGIGPEVVLRALQTRGLRQQADFVIVGHEAILDACRDNLNLRLRWKRIEKDDIASSSGVCLWEPDRLSGRVPRPGRWNARTGRLSLSYVENAIELCQSGPVQGMVTGPICKAAWKAAGGEMPGHTELLAARTHTNEFAMMLVGGRLRVALVTIHEPLARVPTLITTERVFRTARLLHLELQRSFQIARPRLAIVGLNPHAGERGHMGQDEERIQAAIRQLRRRKIDAVGPLPADTVFHHAIQGDYDAVLAMYHDQGLGPLKTIAFDSGVNVTLGLPIIRTSVDHGTAFDLAGTGRASATSCVAAIRLAMEMARNQSSFEYAHE